MQQSIQKSSSAAVAVLGTPGPVVAPALAEPLALVEARPPETAVLVAGTQAPAPVQAAEAGVAEALDRAVTAEVFPLAETLLLAEVRAATAEPAARAGQREVEAVKPAVAARLAAARMKPAARRDRAGQLAPAANPQAAEALGVAPAGQRATAVRLAIRHPAGARMDVVAPSAEPIRPRSPGLRCLSLDLHWQPSYAVVAASSRKA
jgi:hypothetical protein